MGTTHYVKRTGDEVRLDLMGEAGLCATMVLSAEEAINLGATLTYLGEQAKAYREVL
jgi:hypothetical protein